MALAIVEPLGLEFMLKRAMEGERWQVAFSCVNPTFFLEP